MTDVEGSAYETPHHTRLWCGGGAGREAVTNLGGDDLTLPALRKHSPLFLNAKQTVSDKMSEIYQSIQDGSATDEDRKRLKNLREQYIALSKEVEDVMGRLLIGKHLHHS